jgi:hypothetical protein
MSIKIFKGFENKSCKLFSYKMLKLLLWHNKKGSVCSAFKTLPLQSTKTWCLQSVFLSPLSEFMLIDCALKGVCDIDFHKAKIDDWLDGYEIVLVNGHLKSLRNTKSNQLRIQHTHVSNAQYVFLCSLGKGAFVVCMLTKNPSIQPTQEWNKVFIGKICYVFLSDRINVPSLKEVQSYGCHKPSLIRV